MNTAKNSRTTTTKKNANVGRPQKEKFYLKDDFTSYLQGKDLAPSTIKHCLWEVGIFLAWIDKEEIQITKPDVLKYLEYLKDKRSLQNISRSNKLIFLNHYFTFLLKNEVIGSNPCALIKIRGKQKKKLHRIYTPDELRELYDNFYQLFVRDYNCKYLTQTQLAQARLNKERNAVILNILIHQGITTREANNLQLCDLDLMTATIKIRGGKKSNERTLALEATQIGVLMFYIQNTRPQLLEYQSEESEKLFLSLPSYSKKQTNSKESIQLFARLKMQIKSIDKHFVCFHQIRTSVITNWLKVHGLRKTQIMAGHHYITSTEKYLVNDLEGLTNDIGKLHPFL